MYQIFNRISYRRGTVQAEDLILISVWITGTYGNPGETCM